MLGIRVVSLLEGFPCQQLLIPGGGLLRETVSVIYPIAPKPHGGIITLGSEEGRWRSANTAKYFPYPSTNAKIQNGENTSD